MTLDIPDFVVAALGVPRAEAEAALRKEFALALYARAMLSAGKAAEWSGVSRFQFEELLCHRHITRPFSEEDLAEDLRFAQEFSKGQ